MGRKRIDPAVKDEKNLRLLERVTDKLATKIAEKIVDTLALRLADKIAERVVYHQRWATMTDEDYARQCLEDAGWQATRDGWSPPEVRNSRRYTLTMEGLPACVVMPSKPPPKCPCASCARARRVAQMVSSMVRGEAAAAPSNSKPSAQRDELDERNERIRLAYNERARGDRRQLEARAKGRKLTPDELAALSLLSAGYRLMPNRRDELGLTTPLEMEKDQRHHRARRTK